jgi:hypothetical protein
MECDRSSSRFTSTAIDRTARHLSEGVFSSLGTSDAATLGPMSPATLSMRCVQLLQGAAHGWAALSSAGFVQLVCHVSSSEWDVGLGWHCSRKYVRWGGVRAVVAASSNERALWRSRSFRASRPSRLCRMLRLAVNTDRPLGADKPCKGCSARPRAASAAPAANTLTAPNPPPPPLRYLGYQENRRTKAASRMGCMRYALLKLGRSPARRAGTRTYSATPDLNMTQTTSTRKNHAHTY